MKLLSIVSAALVLGCIVNTATANQANMSVSRGSSFASNCDLGEKHWGNGQPSDCPNGYHNIIRFSCCANVDSEGNWVLYARDYLASTGHGHPPIIPGAVKSRDPACHKRRGFRATICILRIQLIYLFALSFPRLFNARKA